MQAAELEAKKRKRITTCTILGLNSAFVKHTIFTRIDAHTHTSQRDATEFSLEQPRRYLNVSLLQR